MSTLPLKTVGRDIASGLVVYVVALPLCLGIALASDAPLAAGLVAGVVGGLVVGLISGSHTSVSGPAAGLTAIVSAQIHEYGFSGFLVAVVFAGFCQLALGLAQAGFIASFSPSSVIKGLLAAIGIILILKQLPHMLGHDKDAEGDMAFQQVDGENSFTELIATALDVHVGAAFIGLVSLALLWGWERFAATRDSGIPAPIVVVLFGMGANWVFESLGGAWLVAGEHLVNVPETTLSNAASALLTAPDWSFLGNPEIYVAGLTLALVASLETLLNLEAVDELDPQQRRSPPNRELLAQGAGNVVTGLIGGLPVTSVVVRGSVNVSSGAKTKFSTIFHGALLFVSVLAFPGLLNRIPLSALAAILFFTGFKLAKPKLFKQMWQEGHQQFLPFATTVVLIVLTDLLLGVLIGLAVAIGFILHSNLKRPMRLFREQHLSGEVTRVELANQVSFLNRAALDRSLREIESGSHVLIDARQTDYIDPDIVDLLHEFKTRIAPAHSVQVSTLGFEGRYKHLAGEKPFIVHSTEELQADMTADQVLEVLKAGNERFRRGEQLTRDFRQQVRATAPQQSPLAVAFSCIDSRTPAEHVFDLGIGDIFSVRIAGNVARDKVMASIEYGCKVAGAKLIVVLGHTSCGAVNAALDLKLAGKKASTATGCQHLDVLVEEIQASVTPEIEHKVRTHPETHDQCADEVARLNVKHTMKCLRTESKTIAELIDAGKLKLVGAMYDLSTGSVDFFEA